MIYFSDDFNFKPANFPALFTWLKNAGQTFDFDRHAPALKRRWGDYKNDFAPEATAPDEITTETHRGYNLYQIYESELLFSCASSPMWPKLDLPDNRAEMVQVLYQFFPDHFHLCRAATKKWIDYWARRLPRRIKAGLSFGGSLIYTQALARVLAAEGLDNLFLEHFFTGHDFYCEKRVEPLPNNSILKSDDYCRQIEAKGLNPLDRHLKIQKAQNKNVRQPAFKMPQRSGYALLLGQVSNDFSILAPPNRYKNSVGFYKKMIDLILDQTDLELVIKTHPYEAQKLKPTTQSTLTLLNEHLALKPVRQRCRVSLVENLSLPGLISRAGFGVTLNSQAGLEVLLQGKPLICFGRPFYGGKGFTRDLDSPDIQGFGLTGADLSLSINQYEKFLTFLDVTFEHLVGDGEEYKIEAALGRGGELSSKPEYGRKAKKPPGYLQCRRAFRRVGGYLKNIFHFNINK